MNIVKPRISLLIALFTCLLLVTCGKDNPSSTKPDPPDQTDENRASSEVGTSGGTVTSTDGLVTLDIPAGALSAAETITITKIEPGDLGAEFDEIKEVIGIENAYELGPDGLQFEQPITVTVASQQKALQEDGSLELDAEFLYTSGQEEAVGLDSLRLEPAGEDTDAMQVSGELMHFSPLVETRLDGLISARVTTGFPDELAVGETAEIHIEIQIDGIAADLSGTPVIGTSQGLLNRIEELHPVEETSPGVFESTVQITCTEEGQILVALVIGIDFMEGQFVTLPRGVVFYLGEKTINCVTPEEEYDENIIHISVENGDDETGTGSPDKPYQSIGKALADAKPGNVIKIGPGTYSKETTGETWDYDISEVTLEATDPENPPVLDGAGSDIDNALHTSETAAKAMTAAAAEETGLKNIVIRNFNAGGGFTLLLESGTVNMENVSFENTNMVWAGGTANVLATGNTMLNTTLAVQEDAFWEDTGSLFTQTTFSIGQTANLELENTESINGIVQAGGNAIIGAQNCIFRDNPTGQGFSLLGNAALVMNGGSITGYKGIGINARDNALVRLNGVTISDNTGDGIYFNSESELLVRNSTIKNNGSPDPDPFGSYTHGITLGPNASNTTISGGVDLGNIDEPGNNTWFGNFNYQLYDGRSSDSGTITAAGNHWGKGVTSPSGIKEGPASEGDLWKIENSGNSLSFGTGE